MVNPVRHQHTIRQTQGGHISLRNSVFESWDQIHTKIEEKTKNQKKREDSAIVQGGWDDNRLPRMFGCLFGFSRGRMFLKIAQHGAKSSLYTFWLSSRRKQTSKNRKGVLGCGLAMHMSKRQFSFVKRHTTMNLPKTWWKTIQGSRLSSSQKRTCFPKTQARKGPSSNRANLHLELPGPEGRRHTN